MRGCFSCGELDSKLFLCSGCSCAAYCGKKCQVAHWRTHKETCLALRADLPRQLSAIQALAAAYFKSAATGYNADLAEDLFRHGAKRGSPHCAFNLGVMLENKANSLIKPLLDAYLGGKAVHLDPTKTHTTESSVKGRELASAIAAVEPLGGSLAAAKAASKEAVHWYEMSQTQGTPWPASTWGQFFRRAFLYHRTTPRPLLCLGVRQRVLTRQCARRLRCH